MSARRLGRALAGGIKGSAVAGASGAATYFIHNMISKKVKFAIDHPFLTPIAFAAVGHVLKKKMPTVGAGLIGASGYALGLAFDFNRANKAQTAALIEANNVAALNSASDVGDYNIPDAGDVSFNSMPNDAGDVDISDAMGL
jgi:hypothetical protein